MEAGSTQKSSTGLEANIAGLLSYAFGFVSGIVFYVIEKESTYVRFHALQSILVFVALVVINVVLGFIPILGLLVNILLWPLTAIVWILLMVKAYQGQRFKLPVVGDIAEKNSALPGK